MKLSSPLPQPLPKECDKAAKIFKSFVDRRNNGLDGVIPRQVLENARGFAIFTMFKAGLVFSARGGSGIVIAKLDDGTWSAPSAIGIAGLGVGSQLGAELTDFLVVLNSRSAIKSFMAAGTLQLGGNLSLAIGPLGRNGEASGSVSTSGQMAAMYSYSKTRGLFGGLSVEGSVIVERQDANAQAYISPVTVRMLLGGMVDPPPWAQPLIHTLESCTGLPGNRQWIDEGRRDGTYAFGSPSSERSPTPSFLRKKKKSETSFPPASWGRSKDSGSYFGDVDDINDISDTRDLSYQRRNTRGDADDLAPYAGFATKFESDFVTETPPKKAATPRFSSLSHSPTVDLFETPNEFDFGQPSRMSSLHSRSMSLGDSPNRNKDKMRAFNFPASRRTIAYDEDILENGTPVDGLNSISDTMPIIKPKPELVRPLLPHEGVARAIALYDFNAVEGGDLSFTKGSVIVITQKSDSTDDWWTGKLNGRSGVFPANFVEIV